MVLENVGKDLEQNDEVPSKINVNNMDIDKIFEQIMEKSEVPREKCEETTFKFEEPALKCEEHIEKTSEKPIEKYDLPTKKHNKDIDSEEKPIASSKEYCDITSDIHIFECIRKYHFNNRSNRNILISLSIISKSPLKNIRPLSDAILMISRPYASHDVLILLKQDLEKDWDAYEVDFRTYNIFTIDSLMKEWRIYMNYLSNKEADSLIITEEVGGLEKQNSGKGFKDMDRRVNFNGGVKLIPPVDQEFELFPEDIEYMEAEEDRRKGGNGYY